MTEYCDKCASDGRISPWNLVSSQFEPAKSWGEKSGVVEVGEYDCFSGHFRRKVLRGKIT